MDKKLQKIILTVIKDNDGEASCPAIQTYTETKYWNGKKPTNSSKLISHQLNLLKDENKVFSEQRVANIYYVLLPEGHRVFDNWIKKSWHFVMYDKHNLFVLLSFVVSLVSIVISIVALVKK